MSQAEVNQTASTKMGLHPLRNALPASPEQETITPIIRSTPFSKNIINQASASLQQRKRQRMTVFETYQLAQQARTKLQIEASRPAHNLRLLVGHANMLDSLMLELADAEQEQERWFNQTVSGATKASEGEQHPAIAPTPIKQHIQWADTILEEEDTLMDSASESSDSSDSDSDYDEDVDEEMSVAYATPFRRARTPPAKITITSHEIELDDDASSTTSEDVEDEDSDDGDLALVRVPSHQPPELLHDSDDSDSSEDESMPPSPEQPVFEISEKQARANKTSSVISPSRPLSPPAEQASFFDEGYYLPQRSAGAMIRAF